MDACHLLLGRPWQYDRSVSYNGRKNTYVFNKDGHKIVLDPMKPMLYLSPSKEDNNILLSKGELEKEVKNGCDVMC